MLPLISGRPRCEALKFLASTSNSKRQYGFGSKQSLHKAFERNHMICPQVRHLSLNLVLGPRRQTMYTWWNRAQVRSRWNLGITAMIPSSWHYDDYMPRTTNLCFACLTCPTWSVEIDTSGQDTSKPWYLVLLASSSQTLSSPRQRNPPVTPFHSHLCFSC
jgi:hypothetical protein